MEASRGLDPEMLENIDSLENRLLKFESAIAKGQVDTAEVQFIFRYAHNLKSSLGMLGFSEASGLLHKVESCYDLVRDGRKHATADLVKSSLLVVDILRNHLPKGPGSDLPDTEGILQTLTAFLNSGSEEDTSIPLPFPLDLPAARLLRTSLDAGQSLRMVERLVSTNIDEDFFGMLPFFEQAAKAGTLVSYHPPWKDLPKDASECVVKVLVASSLDDEAFRKAMGSTFRTVRLTLPQVRYCKAELDPDTTRILEAAGCKALEAGQAIEGDIVVLGIGGPSLESAPAPGRCILAVGNYLTGPEDQLLALDRGADAIVLDCSHTRQALLRLEALELSSFNWIRGGQA